MYNILIIDDQETKYKDIASHFNKKITRISWASNSYQALDFVKKENFNFIILDMTFEGESDLAGVDVINEMNYNNIYTPIIILTQFMIFNKSNKKINIYRNTKKYNDFYLVNLKYKDFPDFDFDSNKDIHELPNLHEFLSHNFFGYVGCVLYNSYSGYWIKNLKKVLSIIKEENYEDIIS